MSAWVRVGGLDLEVCDDAVPMGRVRTVPAAPAPRRCASCLRVWQPPNRRIAAYCSPACRAVANAVRYARHRVEIYGRELPEDVAYAVNIRRAHALAGGYPSGRRRLPAAVRRLVWARDGGRCVLCGGQGEEVDHTRGDSELPEDLRVLCAGCHRRVTSAQLRPLPDDEAVLALRDEMVLRTYAPRPLRACDDWAGWLRDAWCAAAVER